VTPEIRILDVVNTDHAALHFLAYRVAWINRHGGFRNDIVCGRGPHLARVVAPGAEITALDVPRTLAPGGVARLLAQLTGHLRRRRYTLVHTHNSITGAVGRMAARLAGVPVTVHTTHGFHFHERMSRAARLGWVTIERVLARATDALFCQNREELAELERLGFAPRHGAWHVGNGIDLDAFRPRAAPPTHPRPVCLSVGRLEGVKNHAMLFRALRRLGARAPETWLVGDGPRRAEYEATVRRAGLAGRVRFLGYRYDVAALTAAADVAVLTSVKEGMPRALMQAMAVGVPVVATDVKGSREAVADGDTGFLVPLDDDAALADRLARLLDTPALREEMGRRGVQHAREHFDEARIVERLAGLYRDVLRRRGLAVPAPRLAGERPA